jgi:hypothetical protein
MKKIKYMAVAAAMIISLGSVAQDNGLTLKLNYSVASPMGTEFKDLVSKTSFKGIGAELMYHVNSKFAAGIETGSQAFYQKYPRQLYKTSDGGDLSAVVSNNVQTAPILLKAQYSFLPGKLVQPFVALAAGGNIITYNQYAGEFSNDTKTKFGFAARPEAGVFVPFRKATGFGLSLSAGYNYMPFNYNGIDRLDNITGKLGVSFPLN